MKINHFFQTIFVFLVSFFIVQANSYSEEKEIKIKYIKKLSEKLSKGETPGYKQLLKGVADADFLYQVTKDKEKKFKIASIGLKIAATLRKQFPHKGGGYYYSALFLGYIGLLKGPQFVLLYLPKIKKWALKAVEIDPGFRKGAPYVLVCALYYEAPPFPVSIGDIYQAKKYCELAYRKFPENCTSYLYLAAIYQILGKDSSSIIKLLQKGKSDCKPSGPLPEQQAWYKNDINTMNIMINRLLNNQSIKHFMHER